MPTDNDPQIRNLIAAARQHAERGNVRQAEQLMRQAETSAPRHPLVLGVAALRALQSGQTDRAVALLEQATAAEATDPELWFSLASARRKLGRHDAALAAIDTLLALDPANLSGLLEKGALEALLGRPRAAAMSYRTALQTIPPGFAAPPWLAAQLEQARAAVEANNRALERHLEAGLAPIRAAHPDTQMARMEQCIDTLLQKRRIFRQQPTFMYFPELPTIEFYDRRQFPWLDAIEAAADDIRAELLDVLADGRTALDPYVDLTQTPEEQWRALNRSRRWSVYSLWREGMAYPEHIARCPRTVAALADTPRWDVPGDGPTALFSILEAGTRIPPHTGPINTRLLVHLPLIVPDGCGFRVGGQTREWVPDKAWVFDDSINHEAWNDSDVARAILIFDVWSPFLSAAEREMICALSGLIGEFYGTAARNRVA